MCDESIIIKQSLSGKKFFTMLFVLLFSSIESLFPLIVCRAVSIYSFSVMVFPFLSSNFKFEFCITHNNKGKNSIISLLFSSSNVPFNLIVFIKFKIKLIFISELSSILLIELKINKELINIIIKNIFDS